jgi:hypothetical protein
MTPQERFGAAIEKLPDVPGCWLWTKALSTSGYGVFAPVRTRTVYAHRYSYELHRGPIPRGLVLDHLCRVPSCVNPHHLEAVTDRVNILRGTGYSARNARRTRCPKGHPLDGVTRRQHGKQKSQRYCLRCNRERAAARKGAPQ